MSDKFIDSSDKFGFTENQWNSIAWTTTSNNKLVIILSVLMVVMIIPIGVIGYTVKKMKTKK
jgi:hypothetical protein